MEHFETEWSITPKPDLATVCRVDRLACDRAGVSKEGFAVAYCKAKWPGNRLVATGAYNLERL